jgi:hypothetical protein
MTNENPFGRAFLIGGVIFAALLGYVISQNGDANLAFRAGYIAGVIGIPTLITAIWATGSKKEWGWVRYVLTVVILTVLTAVIRWGPHLGEATHSL